jgi:hypothetical protein
MVSLLILPLVILFNLPNGERVVKLKDGKELKGVIVSENAEKIDLNVSNPKKDELRERVLKQSEITSVGRDSTALLIGLLIMTAAVLAIAWAWWRSGHETAEMKAMDAEFERQAAEAARDVQQRQEPVGVH